MSPSPERYESDNKDAIREDSRDDRDSREERTRRRSRSRSPRRRSDKERSRSPAPRRSDRERERSRSPAPRRSRSRSPRRGDDSSRRARSKDRMDTDMSGNGAEAEAAANEAAKNSKKNCRVYVGNLNFQVKREDLKDFMRDAGNVVFAEIMMLPNGMSKGCGVVEFSSPDEAQKAIKDLSDQTLLGRPLFIREDREEEARYGAAAISGRAGYTGPGATPFPPRGGFGGGFGGGRGGYGGGFGGGFQQPQAAPGQARHLFVQGIPLNVGWQDLKDLFRAAGSVIRADVAVHPDGSPKGNGHVVFETSADAQNAISMYNGFEFQGSVLDVREDRNPPQAGFGGRGGFGARGRGGFGGAPGGFGGHQGFAAQNGRSFGNDLYADYSGPGGSGGGGDGGYGGGGYGGGGGGFQQGGGFGGRGGFGGAPAFGGGRGGGYLGGASITPSTQIFVKNLPWSTSNEDLVELFQTTGTVAEAEVLFEAGRSKGAGIVQFASIEEAETAIAKFQNYSYGGRPLSLEFNGRIKNFAQAKDSRDS